jgi:hypothetical protein
MFAGKRFSSVDVSTVANIDDEHEELMLANEIHDAVASESIGISPLQFTFEELPLIRVALKIIQRAGDPLIERGLPLGHAADDAFGLIGKFKLIGGQGRS